MILAYLEVGGGESGANVEVFTLLKLQFFKVVTCGDSALKRAPE